MATPENNNKDFDLNEERSKETPWTDDRIRWTAEEIEQSSHQHQQHQHQRQQENENEEEEEDVADTFDPFKPDPRTRFSFEFQVPAALLDDNGSSTDDSDNDSNPTTTTLSIELQGYTDESDEIYVSTGLTLWRSAQHLCHYMVQHAPEVLSLSSSNSSKPPNILELGAGLGLNGILAHQLLLLYNNKHNNKSQDVHSPPPLPPGTVVLTDGDTNALEQLRQNVQNNTAPLNRTSIHVEQLLWRDITEQWQGRSFDVILASDVVYVPEIVRPLWTTIQGLLHRPHGCVYFAYYSQRKVPVTMDFVLEVATEAGFAYQCVDEQDGTFIYKFTWRSEEEEEQVEVVSNLEHSLRDET